MQKDDQSLEALEQAEALLTRVGESLQQTAPDIVPDVERARQHVIDALVACERERLLKGGEAA
jgi:hypothetical protein